MAAASEVDEDLFFVNTDGDGVGLVSVNHRGEAAFLTQTLGETRPGAFAGQGGDGGGVVCHGNKSFAIGSIRRGRGVIVWSGRPF